MKIRKATNKDINACARILFAEFTKQGEKWTQKIARDRLKEYLFLAKHKMGANFCLVEDRKLIGFAFNEFISYEAGKLLWIGEFAIDSGFQGKGYGLEMLKFIEKFARKKRMKGIILATNAKEKAIKIYKKFGFKPTNYIFMEKNFKS